MSSDLQKLQRDYFHELGTLRRCLVSMHSFKRYGYDINFNASMAENRIGMVESLIKERYKKERQRILDERAAFEDKLSSHLGCQTGRFLP